MKRITKTGTWLLAAILATAAAVMAQAPNFGAAIYADGEVFGTKGTADLPPPNEHNMQSFDKLFNVTNSNNPGVQLAVAEAAPGNTAYNGGRWATYVATWTQAGFDNLGVVPILTSYADIHHYESQGYLMTAPAGPQRFFQCPLLPFKGR